MITEPVDSSSLSRSELLGWINDLLKLNLTRIEQLGSGSVHCQILDMIFPGKVPIHKVNWRAKFEYEFVYNYKILQQCFTKFNIPKYIDVERLIKARYQDNFEFAQWMRKYFHSNYNPATNYDPVARRGNVELDFNFAEKVSTKPSTCKDSTNKAPSSATLKSKSILPPRPNNLKDSMYSHKSGGSGHGGSTGNLFSNLSSKENEILADLNNMIERQKADKNPQLEILRSERDFYYSKLRDIDHVLDVYTGNSVETLINNIREVLYLTPEKIAIVCEDGDIKIKNKDEEANKENDMRDDEDVMMDTGNAVPGIPKEKTGKISLSQAQASRGRDVMVIEDEETLGGLSNPMQDMGNENNLSHV